MFCRRHLQFLSVLVALAAAAAQGTGAQSLPPIDLRYSSYCVARDGRVIAYYGEQHRVEVKSRGAVAKSFLQALLATEDRDFYNHSGVSLKSLGRAVWQTLTGRVQGGSTLTMQLARNLFLSQDRTVARKLAEMDLARELEKQFTKDQILLLYINTVYFGRGAYGVWAAAEEYFSKSPDKLTVPESALLVGLLQAPSAYEPVKHPEKALARRNEVLHNLVETGDLSDREFQSFRRQPIAIRPREAIGRHFAEQVRREASDILRSLGLGLQTAEYRIVTTMDRDAQRAAENAVRAQWAELPASARSAQVGVASVDAFTGGILALVGGNPASEARGLNRATQIRRQPGSAFKPFLYASLLEKGFTLATPIPDVPIAVDSGTAYEWRPMNDDGTWSGADIAMQDAIRKSINLPAAHAIHALSSPAEVAAFAHRCGISSPLPEVPSLALGTGEVSPLEMASAFAVFAAGGVRARPHSILRIEDKSRRVLYEANPDTARVLDAPTAFLITRALEAAVDSGTASAVRRWYRFPAAGKTGTTQRFVDAWFVGYTPSISTAVWIGFDDASRKLEAPYRYGGSACAPLWGRMMANLSPSSGGAASAPFSVPEGVMEIELCSTTGLQATVRCPRKRIMPVSIRLMPVLCPLHLASGE